MQAACRVLAKASDINKGIAVTAAGVALNEYRFWTATVSRCAKSGEATASRYPRSHKRSPIELAS
jgi:hypothetical protein